MAHGRFDNPIVAALAGVKDFFSKQDLQDRLKKEDRADGKTVVITGANSGLGYGTAVEFAKRGARVIMACRRQIPEAGEKVKAESGSNTVEMRYLDLSKIPTIHSFADDLKRDGIHVDILVLNAGVALPNSRPTESGLEEMFLVNYMANVILVSHLLKDGIIRNKVVANNNKAGHQPRMLFISSDSHQGSSYIDHEQFGTFESYGVTKGMNYYSYYKLVMNTYFTELSRRLNKNGPVDVVTNVMCPGPVNSEIIKEAPWLLQKMLKGIFSIVFKAPEEAALPVVYMCLSPDFADRTNTYLHMFNEKRMDEKIYIPEEGRKLWIHTYEVWQKYDDRANDFMILKEP
ncbi:MAG: SDR family NAD(P)-dependent oxidoreductase [Cyclobacteriaceae bacterium]